MSFEFPHTISPFFNAYCEFERSLRDPPNSRNLFENVSKNIFSTCAMAASAGLDLLLLKPMKRCVMVVAGSMFDDIPAEGNDQRLMLGCATIVNLIGVQLLMITAPWRNVTPEGAARLRKQFLEEYFIYKAIRSPANLPSLEERVAQAGVTAEIAFRMELPRISSLSQLWYHIPRIARFAADGEIDELAPPNEPQGNSFVSDDCHTLGTKLLIQSLKEVHASYLKQGLFSKDDIADMTIAYQPGLKTTLCFFVLQYMYSSEPETDLFIRFEDAFYRYTAGENRPIYSRLYYQENIDAIAAILVSCQKLLTSYQEIAPLKEDLLSYLLLFFLHEPSTDMTEASQRRREALLETEVSQRLMDPSLPASTQRAFLQDIAKLEKQLAHASQDILQPLITGMSPWRERDDKEIKRAFFTNV